MHLHLPRMDLGMSDRQYVAIVAGEEVEPGAVLSMCESHIGVHAVIVVPRLNEAVHLPVKPIVILVIGSSGTSGVAFEELLSLAKSGTTIVLMGAAEASDSDDPALHTVAVCQIPADAPTTVLHRALDEAIAHRSSSAAHRSEGEEQVPAHVNRPQLSAQEERTLQLYASGLKLTTVARQLRVKPSTAKEYIERIREKYRQAGRPAQNKFELRLRAIEDGYLQP